VFFAFVAGAFMFLLLVLSLASYARYGEGISDNALWFDVWLLRATLALGLVIEFCVGGVD